MCRQRNEFVLHQAFSQQYLHSATCTVGYVCAAVRLSHVWQLTQVYALLRVTPKYNGLV